MEVNHVDSCLGPALRNRRDGSASAPAGFDMIGFIQAATVTGGAANTNPLAGGTLTINGITMTVPKNSIVQMPAASFTWAQLFDPAFSAAVGTYVPARPNHPAGRTGFAFGVRGQIFILDNAQQAQSPQLAAGLASELS